MQLESSFFLLSLDSHVMVPLILKIVLNPHAHQNIATAHLEKHWVREYEESTMGVQNRFWEFGGLGSGLGVWVFDLSSEVTCRLCAGLMC